MPIRCKSGKKAKFRFRITKNGIKQRLAFCGKKVVEVATFKGKKKELKEIEE